MVPHYDELMRRRVADVMTKAVTHVEPQTPLTRVLELMVSFATRSLPVLSLEHKLVGIISREDVMRALRETTQCARIEAGNPPTVARPASRKDPPPTTSR